MCRFLLAKSKKPIKPYEILKSFSKMAQKSKAFDGDWQGDGWGISWLVRNEWKLYKSLSPIWREEGKFADFPESNLFAIHARSASFPQHKNNLEFNQPFITDSIVFVFNGLLKGVKLPFSVPGKIGAEKIWHLVQYQLKENAPKIALNNVKELLITYTREIQALNIGLIHNQEIYYINYYTKHP